MPVSIRSAASSGGVSLSVRLTESTIFLTVGAIAWLTSPPVSATHSGSPVFRLRPLNCLRSMPPISAAPSESFISSAVFSPILTPYCAAT